jgi:DNA-binding NarL/FixJ family response regulator
VNATSQVYRGEALRGIKTRSRGPYEAIVAIERSNLQEFLADGLSRSRCLVAEQAIQAEHPQIGVLVLSQYVEPSYAMRLIQEQPERVGYLLKERVFDIATVVDALRRIVDGETMIDPTIVSRLVGRRRRQDPLSVLKRAGN